MKPRRQQKPITIRSDKAAQRLALFTQHGRSQAAVIEDALERLPVPPTEEERNRAFVEEIDKIIERAAKAPRRWKSLAEFDEATYDERGLLK
jgi:antitoxin VapB